MVSHQQWSWKKSSYSTGQNNCVESAADSRGVQVRDTKDRTIPAVVISPAAWSAFVGLLR